MIHAANLDDLVPLLALCRAGKLFDVQDWIRQGKPIALPEGAGSKDAHRNPLRIAMDCGFHSLVHVLLEAGAPQRQGKYRALDDAVSLRRPDLVELLFRHGAKVDDVSMRFVLENWEPAMVDLFLSRGASLGRDRPVAWALVARMRPALGLLKRFGAQQPDLMTQAAFALRYHAYEGNAKWTALLLWAGADPCERGPYRVEQLDGDPSQDDEDDEPRNAVELAVAADKLELLKIPKMAAACRLLGQRTGSLIERACWAEHAILSFLLEQGHRPSALPDCGTRAVNRLLHSMTYDSGSYLTFGRAPTSSIDSSRARDRMQSVHLLLAHGARWLPENAEVIGDVRRSLVKMAPGYLLEFAWLLRAYGAARRRDLRELFRTPAVQRLLGDKRRKAAEIIEGTPEELSDSGSSDAAPWRPAKRVLEPPLREA